MKKCLLALTALVCLGCSRDERTVDTEDNPVVVEYFKERALEKQVSQSNELPVQLPSELKRFDAKLVEEQIRNDPAFSSFRWITPTALLVVPSEQFDKTSFEKLCDRIPQTRPDVDFAVSVNSLPLGIGFVHCVRNTQE